MITLDNVSLRFGNKLIFNKVDLSILRREKIGIVGQNGSGKSSLFKVIEGKNSPDSGSVQVSADHGLASVEQTLPSGTKTAINYVLDGDHVLRQTEDKLENAKRQNDPIGISEAHDTLQIIDGYQAKSRGARILRGLGFSEVCLDMAIDNFSGGWKAKLNMAKALMHKSEIVLLDEPTNHLDLESITWLGRWLKNYLGTVLVISHDRSFLDIFCEKILHIENKKLNLYKGNYSSYEVQRLAQLKRDVKLFKKQQREIRKIREFVEKFRSKASKAKQAQSRIKAIDRMEELAVLPERSKFDFSFEIKKEPSDSAICLEKIRVSRESKEVLICHEFIVRSESRIGILGCNGSGKTTLMNVLAGKIKLESGKVRVGKNTSVGYFSQSEGDNLNLKKSPIELMGQVDREASDKDLRNFLASFGFNFEMVNSPISKFSGGEKSRLTLALLARNKPNLLLLDEPTNHLDIDMRSSLIIALQRFEGAMVVVSHDRNLLESTCNEFYLIKNRKLIYQNMGLENYIAEISYSKDEGAFSISNSKSKKSRRRSEAEKRNNLLLQLKPLRKKQGILESEIERMNSSLRSIEEKIVRLSSDKNIKISGKEMEASLKELASLRKKINDAEEQWMAVTSLIEEVK